MRNGKDKNKNQKFNKRGKGHKRRPCESTNVPADSTRDQPPAISDGGNNDISWYSRYPSLLEATARLPFALRPGMSTNMVETAASTGVGSTPIQMLIPGVLAIDWYPTPGYAAGSTYDAASQVAREMYARVRQAYSGELEADGPDMFMYVMALTSIFSYIAWLKRVYRCLTAWSPVNYTIPTGVLKACGLSDVCIQDLTQHRMDLYGHINDLIYQSRTFLVPNVFDIMRRHYWMNDNVYLDADGLDSQIYVYNQAGWYQFAETGSDPTSSCQLYESPALTAETESQLYNFGQKLLNALYNWSTARTINGYFRRAFENEPVFVVDELRMDERLEPIYSEEVLMQIENVRIPPIANVLGLPSDLGGMAITQNVRNNTIACPNEISWKDTLESVINISGFNLYNTLNIRTAIPTVAEIVVASRMNARFTADWIESTGLHVIGDTGTEWPLQLRLIGGVPGDTSANSFSGKSITGIRNLNAASQQFSTLEEVALESWDWHPFIPTVATVNGQLLYVPGGDVHNITTVRTEDLVNIHRVCVMSEFNAYSII